MQMQLMQPHMFIALNPVEEERFRRWARENYTIGTQINAIWHPVVVQECATMNVEAWRANPYPEDPE